MCLGFDDATWIDHMSKLPLLQSYAHFNIQPAAIAVVLLNGADILGEDFAMSNYVSGEYNYKNGNTSE